MASPTVVSLFEVDHRLLDMDTAYLGASAEAWRRPAGTNRASIARRGNINPHGIKTLRRLRSPSALTLLRSTYRVKARRIEPR